MIATLLTASASPLMQQLFPPVPLVQHLQQTPILIFAVLDLCLAAAYLALWRAAPDFRAFRTLGVFFALVSFQQLFLYFGSLNANMSFRAIAAGVLVESAADAMRIQRRRWTWVFWPVYLYSTIAVWFPHSDVFREVPLLVSEIPLAILIVQGFRRGDARDKMIAYAFSMYFFIRLTLSASAQEVVGVKQFISIAGWEWYYATVALTVFGTVTLTIFARDLIRDRSEKQRLAAELAASRAVQQILIPENTPAIPGFLIRPVYEPFGEVGGDFFQILALAGGGVLVAIGDVSGKGMPAAMMVSLLVGTLHALVETTTNPGQLLAGLNRLVQGRSHGGFTTCLILSIERNGTATFANAGHISPYFNGLELECENGLPLGLVAGTVYAERRFTLNPGEQLTLITDGVVEARNGRGELFGFERTASLSGKSAETIAKTAQAFGQEDDITVLTVKRVAATA